MASWFASAARGLRGSAFLIFLFLLAASAGAVEFTTNTTITSNQYNGEDIIVTGCVLTIDCSGGQGTYRSLLVRDNGVVTHPAGSTNGLWLEFTQDVEIQAGSAINVTGRGYPKGSGPGVGGSRGGGGHGGNGGSRSGYAGGGVYDSITAPSQLGSGGGVVHGLGGAGGGLLRMVVGGALTVNGLIAADGTQETYGGGGAGGSLWIQTGVLTGAGTIRAHGASVTTEERGGGGGGRIALTYDTHSFSGTIAAYGGAGNPCEPWRNGGAGSVYTKRTGDPYGLLVIDGGGTVGQTTHAAIDMPDTDMVIRSTQISFDCGAAPLAARNLLIGDAGVVSHVSGSVNGLRLEVSGSVTIETNGAIDLTGRGYGSDTGPGRGQDGAGGGHGGSGGARSRYKGGVYDSITAPSQLGSGGGGTGSGPGGSGGGLLRMVVGGALTMNGLIAADGASQPHGGGGSGGAVWIQAGTLAGNGAIRAHGATAIDPDLAGGGGGRIAVTYDTQAFGGSITAYGGFGSSPGQNQDGGAGTVYTKGSSDAHGLLVINGDGVSGLGYTVHPAIDMPDTDIVIQWADVSFDCTITPVRAHSLLIGGSGFFRHPASSEAGLGIQTTGSVTVEVGGFIDVSARGYGSDSGPGRGQNGRGGGYGGRGGGRSGTPGGDRYGWWVLPGELGSGGGSTGSGPGAPGGGKVTIHSLGTVQIEGVVLARGGWTQHSGAGSGGCIRIAAQAISGNGILHAEGGMTDPYNADLGAGGGGRIALYTTTGQVTIPEGNIHYHRGNTGNPLPEDGTLYIGRTFPLPDLAFRTDRCTFQWNPDGTGTVYYEAVNYGLGDADGVRIEIFDRNPALPGARSLAYQIIPSLHSMVWVGGPITFGPAAANEVWVVLDPLNGIAEGDETNNTIMWPGGRTATSLYTINRTGTITEMVTLRGYLRRLPDMSWLDGKTITFAIDGTPVGSAVTGGTGTSGRADLNWVIGNGPSTRTIQAVFDGDETFGYSSGTATLTAQYWLTKMATFNRTARISDTTELKCRLLRSDNVPVFNKPINFYVDGTFVISRLTNTDGYASYPYYDVPDGAGAGTRTILSEWPGNAGYAAISRTSTLTVLKALPYIWVLPKSVPQGSIASLDAVFRRLYDYQKQEGKPVTFRIDGTWIADVVTGTTASGEPGVARYLYNTSGLSKGSHTIRCEFAGDAWVEAGFGEGGLTIY